MYHIRKKGVQMSQVEQSSARPAADSHHRVGAQRLLGVLLGFAAGCLIWSSPALAGQARLLTGLFGTANSTPVDPYPLSSAESVAVDSETHDIYVADAENNRVEKFDSTGHFILMFGKAVDRTTGGNVCTALSGDICQVGVAGASPGAFEFNVDHATYDGIAVDNSGVFGQQGDVYVSGASVVSKFSAEGDLISSWGDNGEGISKSGPPNGQLNGSNATGVIKGPFGIIHSVAVDLSGNLWVNASPQVVPAPAGQAYMFEFRPTSSFETTSSNIVAAGHIAVNSEDDIYIAKEEITKFDSTGDEIGLVQGGGFTDVAVDPGNNEFYAADGATGVISRYDDSCNPHKLEGVYILCTPAESFGSSYIKLGDEIWGLAIDPLPGTLYAAENQKVFENGMAHPARVLTFSVETTPDVVTAKAAGFTGSSATLSGSVDPAGVELESGAEGCRFEWGEHGVGEPNPYGHIAPCEETAAQIGSGSTPVEVHSTISGLQQGRTYHFRLVAGNHDQINGLIDEPSSGSDLAFGPPSVEGASAVSVGASSAVVQAQVNPNNVDTHVRAEYGIEAGKYGQTTPELDLGAGGTSQPASFQLLGLTPGMTYHYRLIAENALGEGSVAIISPDRAFTTQTVGGSFQLPDSRAWEIVSPPDKHGTQPLAISEEGLIQAAASGDAITYITTAPTEVEPQGSANGIQVLSRRTSAGWESQDIAAPHDKPTGSSAGSGPEYSFFSNDLSRAVLQPFGEFVPQLSLEASEQTPYLRTNFSGGEIDAPCITSCYRPLVTGAEGYEDVPSETVFAPTCSKSKVCGPTFLGASSDLRHIIFTSEASLVEGAPAVPARRVGSGEGSLYEWTAGKLALVSVLPDDLPAPAGGITLGYLNHVARNAVSPDGSRVVWSDGGGALYVRDVTREKTVRVSSDGVFQMASSDVSKVFFTENGDLRECDIVESEGELGCDVSDLSPAGAGENPNVLGLIAGASEDGSYVYFVANAVLENHGVPVSGAQPEGCSTSGRGMCNLYVSHGGTVKLVAELSADDSPDWAGGGLADLAGLTAYVSPDGDWLAFMSDRSLTGYDDRDATTGGPDEEVYLYNASANGGEGRVVCASCDPTGARPHGLEYSKLAGSRAFGRVDFASDQGIGANVPGWTPYRHSEALHQSRYLSESGRLFFNSTDALVAQDSNGVGDVYEYEPAGVGDCTTESAAFVATRDGCLSLISSGASKEESGFVEASENGDDVFFESGAQLSPLDTDNSVDVYDARVDGGFPEPPLPPACEGDACQSPVSAPEDPTPGSLTYSGPGNPSQAPAPMVVSKHKAKPLRRAQKLTKALAACRREKSKRTRSQCVRRANKRYGHDETGRATTKKKGR